MVAKRGIPIQFAKGCFHVEGALTRSELATAIRVIRRQLGVELTSTHHPKISWPTLKQLAVEVTSDDDAIRQTAESALRRKGFDIERGGKQRSVTTGK